MEHLRRKIARLNAVLEDIVDMALSSGDAKQRVAQMHQRAVTELSQADSNGTR